MSTVIVETLKTLLIFEVLSFICLLFMYNIYTNMLEEFPQDPFDTYVSS